MMESYSTQPQDMLNEEARARQTAEDLSAQVADTVLFVSILFCFYIVLGIIGNSFVIYIYHFKFSRCNFKYFVIGLAVIDLLSCVTTIPGEVVVQRNLFNYPNSMMWLCKIKSYFNGFTVFTSAFILLLISFDRYRKVCRPLGWQMNPSRAKLGCFILFIVSVLLATPVTILWGKQTDVLTVEDYNVTVTRCDRANAYKNTKWPTIYAMAILILPTIIYMIITGVFYALILKEILFGNLALKNIRRKYSQSVSLIARSQSHPPLQRDDSSQISCGESTTTISITQVNQKDIPDNQKDSSQKKFQNESDEEIKSMPQVVSTRRKSSVAKHGSRMQDAKMRLRTKTLIMFVLTVVFACTAFLYFALLAKGMKTEEFIHQSKAKTVFYLLAMRFYFVNHIINPFVYSLMDERFRQKFKEIFYKPRNLG